MSSTDSLSGTVSLQEYKGLSHLDGLLLELKQCGLTEDEIELKLEDMGHLVRLILSVRQHFLMHTCKPQGRRVNLYMFLLLHTLSLPS